MKKKPNYKGFFSDEELKKKRNQYSPEIKEMIEREKKAKKKARSKARSEAAKKGQARRAAKKKMKGFLDQ